MVQKNIVSKKIYTKPRLEQVKLVLEEAVLAGCKLGGGPGVEGASNCGIGDCNLQNAS